MKEIQDHSLLKIKVLHDAIEQGSATFNVKELFGPFPTE